MLQLMIDTNVEEDGEQSCPVGGKKLSNEQITAHSLTFFLAGYETTANTLSYTAYLLAIHPEVQEKLQRDIDSYMEDKPVGLNRVFCQLSIFSALLGCWYVRGQSGDHLSGSSGAGVTETVPPCTNVSKIMSNCPFIRITLYNSCV